MATVAAQAGPGGNASGGGQYALGKEVTLAATANNGYTFDGWYQEQNKVSSNNSYDFRVMETKTYSYEARFTSNSYSVTLTPPADGHWTADSATKSTTYGGKVAFTLTPAEGYTFKDVQLPNGDGIAYTYNAGGGTVTATLSNVTETTTIKSSLKASQFQAKWTTDGGESWVYGDLSEVLTEAAGEGGQIEILTAVDLPSGTLKN